MAREGTERRVYVLPAELVERIRSFQRDERLPSETEAARQLLELALLDDRHIVMKITRLADECQRAGHSRAFRVLMDATERVASAARAATEKALTHD